MSANNPMPSVLPNDSPRARRTDPISSHEAADATAGIVAESQRAVASLFRIYGALTAADVEDRAAAWKFPYSPSRLRTALTELEARGVIERADFIVRDGETRKRQLWKLVTA